MARLSAVDAAWYQMEEAHSAADIVGLLAFEGELDAAHVRTLLETRLLSRARFRQRVVSRPLGLKPPEWQDEVAASIDEHFSRRRIPAPGGAVELAVTVNELLNEPLDFRRSPWRVCLLDGASDGSVLFTQLHHCLGDGFALVDVLLSLADESSAASSSAAPRRRELRARLSAAATLGRRLPRVLFDLVYLLRLPFDPENSLRGEPAGTRRVAWSEPLQLSLVKELAHARGATVNELLLAATSGGLRRYLSEHGRVPEQLRALVPINLRPKDQPIDPERGNWFGLLFVPLPVLEAERDARIARLKQTFDAIKRSEQAIVSLGVLAALGLLPRPLEHFVERVLSRKASVVVSNVPGPRAPFHLAGRRVRDAMFWVPHPGGLACGISILSYAGSIRIGVRTDTSVVPDPERIVRYIEREIADCISPQASSADTSVS